MLCGMCRIVVFSVRVLKDERIVVVAEQRPECTEEQVQLLLFMPKIHYKHFPVTPCGRGSCQQHTLWIFAGANLLRTCCLCCGLATGKSPTCYGLAMGKLA